MLSKLKQRENGDTIVEVLISLAILTAVLVGAYYTANESFRNDRDSQEHTEALTIAETQLEDLRTAGTISASDQCFNSSGVAVSSCYIPTGNTTQNLTQQQCKSLVGSYCYSVDISNYATVQYNVPSTTPAIPITLNTYEVNVTWTGLSGASDNVSLYYRQDQS